jgi:uncharacterized protein YjbI with pentapeptide repeats
MGLRDIHRSIFVLAMLLWGAIFGTLFFGLLKVLWELIWSSLPDPESDEVWKWRFSMVKLTALTATLGAVVALPFTLVRLTLTRRQTQTAVDALFNDKVDAAVSDLHAQRRVTKWLRSGVQNGWEDDITRRNGAINRLEGLAGEDPDAAPRIARMLSVYVRELSRELPTKASLKSTDRKTIQEWKKTLKPARSDMQNAAQVLGRVKFILDRKMEDNKLDLRETNMQGCDLSDLNFSEALFEGANLQGVKLSWTNLEFADLTSANLKAANLRNTNFRGANLWKANLQGAGFGNANLQGADLSRANLEGGHLSNTNLKSTKFRQAKLKGSHIFDADLNGAKFTEANLRGAYFFGLKVSEATDFSGAYLSGAAAKSIDFTETTISKDQLAQMFGDASVILPGGHGHDHKNWPKHWHSEKLDWAEFSMHWRAFRVSIGQDPDAP